jgi:hypothetical protein
MTWHNKIIRKFSLQIATKRYDNDFRTARAKLELARTELSKQ